VGRTAAAEAHFRSFGAGRQKRGGDDDSRGKPDHADLSQGAANLPQGEVAAKHSFGSA